MDLAMGLGRWSRENGGPPIPPAALRALLSANDDNWKRFGASAYTPLRSALRDFDRTSTAAAIGGLLTEPEFQVGTLRLEVLQHIVVSACRGTRHASDADLRRWVNDVLGALPVRRMEDPVEDVFVSNVVAPGGNFRLFEGIWELNDASVQALVEALCRTPWRRQAPPVLPSVLALLRMSETVAERAGTPRWIVPERTSPTTDLLPHGLDLNALRSRVHFSLADLASLEIDPQDLAPFILDETLRSRLRSESLGHTLLERFPLLPTDDGVVLTCPPAVSPAIRRYVLEACEQAGAVEGLASALRWVHARAVFGGALTRVNAPEGVGGAALPAAPVLPPAPLPWDEVHCAIDVDKAAVVVLLSDSLADAARTGLSEPAYDPERGPRLSEHLRETAASLATSATGGGLVVVVYAGIGRGFVWGGPHLPPRWHTVVMSAGDFGTFARSPDASLLRLWKLEAQRDRLADAGIEVPDTNGTLNTYAFWSTHHYSLCPGEMPYPAEAPSLVQIGTEFVHGFRVDERRLHDVHAVALDRRATRMVRVHRLGRAAFFPAMLERPLYVSEEAAQEGDLVGVCEHPALTVWVFASKPTAVPEARYFIYQLWEAVLSWLDRLVPEIVSLRRESQQPALPGASPDGAEPLKLSLEFADETAWRALSRPGEPVAARPSVRYEPDLQRIVVAIPFGFITLLRQPTNDGERALLESVAEALLAAVIPRDHDAVGIEWLRATARDAVMRAMRNADARHVHLFEAASPTDQIAALQPGRAPEPRFVFEEDLAAWTEGLAWQVFTRDALAPEVAPDEDSAEGVERLDPSRVRVITGRKSCTHALSSVVQAIWTRLRGELEQVNLSSLVTLTLENLESIARDREQWRRTARALLALYGDADDVERISTQREARRTTAGTAGRALVEMAVCTCPAHGGRHAALSDLDHLLAGVSELIGLAFDSDAIHSGLAAPQIRVQPNGALMADRTFIKDVVAPFSSEVHASGFRAAAAAYADLYRQRPSAGAKAGHPPGVDQPDHADGTGATNDPAVGGRPAFDPEFCAAFAEEFGLTPERVMDGFAELVEMGLEGEALVVHTSRATLAERLAAARSFTDVEVTSFLDMLALVPRPRWDETPPGFRPRDWEPWRFRRRLSLTARPLVACGPVDDAATPIFYGLYHLGTSVSYLFENVQSAWLPAEFFTSDAMIRYRGHVADAEGAAFTQEVGSALRALGWYAVTEIQMATLGAAAELGDLDVVAWRDADPRLLLIECKRLQPARTVGEIAEVLKQFRGEGNDRLGRHMRRYAWVRAHPEALARHLGISALGMKVRPALVTNRHVPMRFQADLPLSPDQIIPLDALAERLTLLTRE